ncbi:hypothetical protein K435DRAFT_622741, partial [Dendrothele bispora CBS 962.96]
LIGALQKINTDDHIGGSVEGTIMKSQLRVANIRRWLRRPDCPEAIKQLKILFDKCFVLANSSPTTNERVEVKGTHRSYVRFDGVIFSPWATHEGNSNIFYRPSPAAEPVAGRIERINNIWTPNGVTIRLLVRQNLPLPKRVYDPFHRFPDFPGKTYSSQTKNSLDDIGLDDIVTHAARFDFSHDRSVFCNLSRA